MLKKKMKKIEVNIYTVVVHTKIYAMYLKIIFISSIFPHLVGDVHAYLDGGTAEKNSHYSRIVKLFKG